MSKKTKAVLPEKVAEVTAVRVPLVVAATGVVPATAEAQPDVESAVRKK